jgi:hypothetical protein
VRAEATGAVRMVGVPSRGAALPPEFLEKMQLHWSKVQNAFRSLDRANTGKLQRSAFEDLCARFSCDMSKKQMDQVATVVSRNTCWRHARAEK